MSNIKITAKNVNEIMAASQRDIFKIGDKTTVVMLTLPNGFEMFASSACVDAENYDQEVGEQICLSSLQKRIWELEGYVLQTNEFLKKKTDPILER